MQPEIQRKVCYRCHRPQSSCMCKYMTAIETKTRFVILMHPKEFKRTKNGTGHFTNLSLKHCELHVGVDFSKDETINNIISDPSNLCYVLYPSTESLNLNDTSINKEGRNSVIFLIDATWPCSKAMLKASPNLNGLQKISFSHEEVSGFKFKRQPEAYCLSTIESTLCVLKLLNVQGTEKIDSQSLTDFLLPFEKMVEYQLSCNVLTQEP